MAAADVSRVRREFTLFQFDVDEAAVRRLLAAIPGVTPVPPDGDDRSADDDSTPAGSPDATDSDAGSGSGPSPGSRSGEASGPTGGPREGSTPDATDRTRSGRGRFPSTPWPGAPLDEASEESGGWRSRLRGRAPLLAAAAVLVLGVAGAAAWYLKGRGSGERDEPRDAADGPHSSASRPLGRARNRVREGVPRVGGPSSAAGTRQSSDETERGYGAGDAAARSYPVDAAPVVGIAFLALGTALLRQIRRERAR